VKREEYYNKKAGENWNKIKGILPFISTRRHRMTTATYISLKLYGYPILRTKITGCGSGRGKRKNISPMFKPKNLSGTGVYIYYTPETRELAMKKVEDFFRGMKYNIKSNFSIAILDGMYSKGEATRHSKRSQLTTNHELKKK
jgi:hypothetical protein